MAMLLRRGGGTNAVLIVVILAAAAAASSITPSHSSRRKNAPLVFAPGNTGSNLTLTIANAVQLPGCDVSGVPLLSYLKADTANLPDTFARAFCALNAVRQSYDTVSRRFTLPQGVTIDVVGSGDAGDDGLAGIMAGSTLNDGYSLLLDWLRDPAGGGYTPGVDLFGAPYNWMLSEQGLLDFGWWDRIKATIVRAYNDPSNARPRRRVVLLSHSMGAMVFQTLIAREPEFARRYVAGHVAIGGPYGGAAAAWGPLLGGIGSLVATGFDDGTNGAIVRYGTWAMMQTSAALVWTMPYSSNVLGASYGGNAPSQVILRPDISRNPNRMYDVSTQTEILSSVFRFINPDGSQSGKLQFLADIAPFTRTLATAVTAKPPRGVKTVCVYGTGVPTALEYGANGLNPGSNTLAGTPDDFLWFSQYNVSVAVNGTGDGTVGIESLRVCNRVAKRSGGKVFELPGVTHRGAFVQFDVLRAAIAAAA